MATTAEAQIGPASPENVEDFLKEARDRFDLGRTADAVDREEAEDDNRFANATDKDLGQWDPVARRLRAKHKRPIIQWNRIPVSVQSVVNDGRQNKPSIRIAPGDGGDPPTAETIQARIRQIEYECSADVAKDTARDQQVTSGRGFAIVRTEYVPGSKKTKQRICIERIENQFSVVFDPSAQAYDRSDADWAFIISLISKDSHKRRFGAKSIVNRLDFADAAKLAPDWIGIGTSSATGEMIQIAEYWVKEYDADGEVSRVMQYVINGAEILEQHEWIGSTIPIIPFWGREAVVDGTRRTYSLVRNARGPQQLVNLCVSNIAELIGQMPKTPYLVAKGAIGAGDENDWKNVNNSPLGYLLYEAFNSAGQPLPPPSRVMAEPPIQALGALLAQSIDGIKAAMGIYDAALGARSNENSGVAIERRKLQSSITNYHFPDNEARSNKYLGEILVELIPLIDKAGDTIPIRTEDGKTHLVTLGAEEKHWKTGQPHVHDLTQGQYGVVVSQGQSYDSQRQEILERDQALVKANPELIFAIGPQMFRADDSPGSEERAEALERYINLKFPGLVPPKDEQGQQIPQQVQQQMMQMQQELQKTHAFAQSLHEQLATKQPELANALKLKQMDLDFKREELAEKSRVELAKLGIGADIARLEAEIEALKHQAGLQAQADQQQAAQEHAMGLQQTTQQHAAEMADKGHQNAMEQQTQAQQAAQEQAENNGGDE